VSDSTSIRDISLLVLHLIRNEDVVRRTIDKLDPALFSYPGELHLRWLWGASRWHFIKYGVMIRRDALMSMLGTTLDNDPAYFTREQLTLIARLTELAYTTPQESAPYVINVAQEILQERTLKPLLHSAVMTTSGSELRAHLNEVIDATAATTLTAAAPAEMFSAENNVFETASRRQTGVDFVDYVCGGSETAAARTNDGILPGDTILVLGVTGAGKTTLGCQVSVEAARRDWRVGFFGFEYPLKPRIERVIFGYAAGIPRNVMESPERYPLLSTQDQTQYNTQLMAAKQLLNNKLFMFDMVIDRSKGVGIDGMTGVENMIREYDLDLAIIDQATSVMAADRTRDAKMEDRHYLEYLMRRCEALAGGCRRDGEPCTFMVLHQTDTAAKQRHPTTKPSLAMGSECKSMEDYSDTTLVVGRRDDAGVGYIGRVKGRSGKKIDVVTKLLANYRIEGDIDEHIFSVEGQHFHDSRTGYAGSTPVKSMSEVDGNKRRQRKTFNDEDRAL